MTPEEIAASNESIVVHGLPTPHPGVVVREIREPSVVFVLPVAHAEALSMCANVGLEGAPDQVIGDLAWASVSKIDEAIRLAKTSPVDDEPEPFAGGPGDEPGPAGGVDDEREAARDDARGEADR